MMKRMDLFCASPASTAICSSMDERSVVQHGTRPLDRGRHRQYHHPHHLHHRLRDRIKDHAAAHIPCSSPQMPFTPRPYFEKSRKSTNSTSTANYSKDNKLMVVHDNHQSLRRKSSADVYDLATTSSPYGSARYLLSDKPFSDWPVSDSLDRRLSSALVPVQPPANSSALVPAEPPANNRVKSKSSINSPSDSPSLKSSHSARSRHQVVALRVSIHCKGCESKVRKHLSKMEGVTSFSIDMESKKVTVTGNVTPLAVLASVSRVKNAQLWPSSFSTTSTSPSWSA